MNSIDDKITEIKAKLEKAKLTQARAIANHEAAQMAYNNAMRILQEQFSLDNLVEARDKLSVLQSALDVQLNEVETLLDELNL